MKNFYPSNLLFVFFVIVTTLSFAQEPLESNFFKDTSMSGDKKNIVNDYKWDPNNFNDNDTKIVQEAIDELTKLPKGGILYFPKGRYQLQFVHVKSNVHLLFHKDAVVELPNDHKKYGFIFMIGQKKKAENVSIRGDQAKFTIDLKKAARLQWIQGIAINFVKNFAIENIHFEESYTTAACINFGRGEVNGEKWNEFGPNNGDSGPVEGLLKNLSNKTATFGYGLVQMGVGTRIFFKNLYGEGGTVLRLEPSKFEEYGMHDVFGRDISGKNGNTVVMLSPHSAKCGKVDIRRITSHSCEMGIKIGAGFGPFGNGYFSEESIIQDVVAHYGTTAQVKLNEEIYVPCEAKHLVKPRIFDQFNEKGDKHDAAWKQGPSIAPVHKAEDVKNEGRSGGFYKVKLKKIKTVGKFLTSKILLSESGKSRGWECDRDLAGTFYQRCKFRSVKVPLRVGKYNYNKLAATGLTGNMISAVKIKAGYEAVLYSDKKFRGFSTTISGNIECLKSFRNGRSDGKSWNNEIGSIIIRKKGGQNKDIINSKEVSNLEIECYPTIFSTSFEINTNTSVIYNEVIINSLDGREVYKSIIDPDKSSYSVYPDNLSNGVYFVTLQNKEKGHFSKAIKVVKK